MKFDTPTVGHLLCDKHFAEMGNCGVLELLLCYLRDISPPTGWCRGRELAFGGACIWEKCAVSGSNPEMGSLSSLVSVSPRGVQGGLAQAPELPTEIPPTNGVANLFLVHYNVICHVSIYQNVCGSPPLYLPGGAFTRGGGV